MFALYRVACGVLSMYNKKKSPELHKGSSDSLFFSLIFN